MPYLMINYINILIILFTIISVGTKIIEANISINIGNELYRDFTTIKFLKELQHHSKETYDNILIMQNHNTTVSNVFYSNLKDNLMEHNYTSNYLNAVLNEIASTTFVKQLMANLQVPVLQLNELQSFNLKRQYSEHFLSIVCIDINIEGIQKTFNDHKGLLEKLSQNLLHMTTSKVMFLLNFPLATENDTVAESFYASTAFDEDIIQGVVLQLFQHCWQQKIINVVAILADYQITRKFYSYTHFPKFQLEVKTIAYDPKLQEEVYPYRLNDLKGYQLPIVIGGSDPRIIYYRTSKGKEVIGGFVGHFIETFCEKYNCQLVQPIPFNPEKPIPSRIIINAVRNGTVEISAALTFPEITFYGYSYIYEQLDFCVMMPIEPNIPGYKLFTSVFKKETYIFVVILIMIISMLLSAASYIHGYHPDLLHILCHDICLRGILSQSFSEIAKPPFIIRFIYLQICILGILLTTSYNAHFSTYVTKHPKEPRIDTFDDLFASGLKVVHWRLEYDESSQLVPDYKKYTPLFYLIDNYYEFLELRDSLNTDYGYAVPTTKWNIINEQQKIFTTPLFRYAKNLCFYNNIPMAFPIQENSIFIPLVNQMILEIAQSGIQVYWTEFGFLELIAADKLTFKDLSPKTEFRAMTVDDLQYIMIFMGAMFIFAHLVFFGELLVFRRRKILNFRQTNFMENFRPKN